MAGVKGRSGRRRSPEVDAAELPARDGFLRLTMLDREGNAYFDRLFGVYMDRKILQETDELAFNLFVVTFREWLMSYRTLKRSGRCDFDKRSGATRLSAEFKAERQLFRDVLTMAKEFGFTPASRAAALRMAEPKKEEPGSVVSGFISVDPGEPL